jgi:hypothetical protein
MDVYVSFAEFLPPFRMADLNKVHGNTRQDASRNLSRRFYSVFPMNILGADL